MTREESIEAVRVAFALRSAVMKRLNMVRRPEKKEEARATYLAADAAYRTAAAERDRVIGGEGAR